MYTHEFSGILGIEEIPSVSCNIVVHYNITTLKTCGEYFPAPICSMYTPFEKLYGKKPYLLFSTYYNSNNSIY